MSTVKPIGARIMGELARLLEERNINPDLVQKRCIENINGFISFLNEKTESVQAEQERLLKAIGTIKVAKTDIPFVAKDRFKMDTSDSAAVKISHLGDNFCKRFLGKTEDPINELTLRYNQLSKSSLDGPIIAGLGGEEKAETTLSEMFSLMEKQGNGGKGVLLTNGYANIFYIRDIDGVLCVVYVRWFVGGWYMYAISIGLPDRWSEGSRVFSRNS